MIEGLDNLDVFDLLTKLDIDNIHPRSGGNEAAFSCPFHRDENPSASMNAETGAWICFSCKQRGESPVSLTAKVAGVTYAVAGRWLREAYGIDFKEPEGGSMATETESRFADRSEPAGLVRPSQTWQQTFAQDLYSDVGEHAYEYIRGRGFNSETLIKWKLGYDSSKQRLTIPVYNIGGELVGFKARCLDDSRPKFIVLGDTHGHHTYGFQPYEASQVVFGLTQTDQIVLCESELDAIALWQMGVTHSAAIGMSYFSDTHARLLLEATHEVIVFFDYDESGINGMWDGVVEKLQDHMTVRVVGPHDRDPAKLLEDGDEEEVQALIEASKPSVAAGFALR